VVTKKGSKVKLIDVSRTLSELKGNYLMTPGIRLLVLVFVFVSCGALAARAQAPVNSSTDEAAIRQVVQQVQDGWNAHDGKAFAARFATDADYVVVNGMRTKGRDEIEKGHKAIFSTIYKDSRNVATIQSIRFLRPDVAVAHVEWNLEFRLGGEAKKAQAMNTMVMTKDGGKWSIAAFQNTPLNQKGVSPFEASLKQTPAPACLIAALISFACGREFL
jgi:uncharacterized protein (TIGR02246 family)